MVWIETKLPLEKKGGGIRKKIVTEEEWKENLFFVMFSFYLEKNLKYAKMLTLVNFREQYRGFCFYGSLKFSIFKHFFQ